MRDDGAGGRGAAVTAHAVVVAGAGPTGLMLAGELAVAGTDVVIVERRADQEIDGSEPAGSTPAPSRCSTSGASPDGSSPRAR
jgi:heterodisulfide reductase subunit A-like polyferredoxin